MVFQTAPPQPASKARRTWYSELVGGPEASQNGLGAWTPQKVMLRSGIGVSFRLGPYTKVVWCLPALFLICREVKWVCCRRHKRSAQPCLKFKSLTLPNTGKPSDCCSA